MASPQSNAEQTAAPEAAQQLQFHLEEFKALREEISRLDTAKRQLELFTFTAIALMLSSFFVVSGELETSNLQIVRWLPLLVAIAGALISLSYVRASYRAGRYIRRIESKVAWPSYGWEHFLEAERKISDIVSTRTKIIWTMALAILTIVGSKLCGWSGLVAFLAG